MKRLLHARPLPLLLVALSLCGSAAGSLSCSGAGRWPFAGSAARDTAPTVAKAADASPSAGLLGPARQVTFDGQRSGEGYLSRDGRQMVFQSEREPGNPFYQIYQLDLSTGALHRLSPGTGKATCAWIHPGGRRALFASTHLDPDSAALQAKEIADRAEGRERRYAWDYDPHYDLFSVALYPADPTGSPDAADTPEPSDPPAPLRLTSEFGYDAEASWSPNGREIVFASNRHAYVEGSGVDPELLERDPSRFIELYTMDADGQNVRRLTHHDGYDGGPFFSPDGQRIVWRSFAADGTTAEIHSMARDGSDVRVLTHLGALSWAPFYHPSGDYVIFTTNLHGMDDFELFIVDAEGRHEPVRVTDSRGFDGLPVFGPQGDELFWTSTRSGDGRSQIYRARFDDTLARRRLGLPHASTPDAAPLLPLPAHTDSAISRADLQAHVASLTSDVTEGRLTGTAGERIATSYVARAFRRLGLQPAGEGQTYFQTFGFTAGVSLGPDNRLELRTDGVPAAPPPAVDIDWRPFAFSHEGEVEASPVVYAGYGIVAPEVPGQRAIDAYADLDVEGRWVLVFRYMPEGLEPASRQHLHRYSSIRYKAMVARDHGARGLLVVSGPNSKVREQLAPLRFDVSLAGSSIAALSITDELTERLVAGSGRTLQSLQDEADADSASPGFTLQGVTLAAHIDLDQQRRQGRNVLGRLRTAAEPTPDFVMLGAHVDHLGHGEGSASLATLDERGLVHPGADDNASGVATLLELAESLSALQARGALGARRDIVFAAWSGEELGLLGSSAWVAHAVDPHDDEAELSDRVVAYVNMDMVGRLDESVSVFGMSSSSIWRRVLEQQAVRSPLSISPQDEAFLPTDATPFYMAGVPILSAFTGAHSEYHTPRDRADTLDYDGMLQIASLLEGITIELATRVQPPDFVAASGPSTARGPSRIRVYLGTIPDYAQSDVRGVRLSGVAADGPADRAGLRGGDVVVALSGRAIENIYDYTYALDALKIGEPVPIGVLRDGRRVDLVIVPASRD